MTTVNYPSPVTVNGYPCKNCTDIDYAKKNIDPAHPKDGPFGIDAKVAEKQIVTFGGVLAGLSAPADASTAPTATPGRRLDVSA